MIQYIILKNDNEILLYPPVDGDRIYYFATMEEAQNKLDEIKNLPIYQNIKLTIIASEGDG